MAPDAYSTVRLMPRQISLDLIRDAAASVYPIVVRTPLVRLAVPDDMPLARAGGAELYLKLETLQSIGSFKIRGAVNAIHQLTSDELARGVWTVSAGNAAQGVALAARTRGAACSVMVMETAPLTKLAAIGRLGARLVKASYDECWRAVEEHGSDRMGGVFIHPFDDDRFIAGNATAGLEILEDLPDVDTVIAPIGGGGLIAGVGSALRALKPDVKIVAAEPATAAPLTASLRAGAASRFPEWEASFVDGAGGKAVLPSMWPLLSTLVTDSIVVSLDEVAQAMRIVAERARVVSEGAAACAVAAALTGRAGQGKIVAVVSGGNIDLARFAALTTNGA